MYILALLFSLVNFYFLASAIIVVTGLLVEYILVPLINSGSQILKLPIYYSIQKSSDPQPNIMSNIIYIQDKTIGYEDSINAEENEEDLNNESESDSDDCQHDEKQEQTAGPEFEPVDNLQSQSVDSVQSQSDDEICSPVTLCQEKTPLNQCKKTNSIIIDESLD